MAEEKFFDVFLCHNSVDKPAVETLARRLQDEAGLRPFLDKWHLVPGNPWQEALEEALDASRTCAVFIGPNGVGSWENEELRIAIDTRVHHAAFRVVPVLLPEASLPRIGELPRFLARLTWVDFRAGLDNTEQFQRLVAGIRGLAPGRQGELAAARRPQSCPYRGLEVFDEQHADMFFGREALTQHLVEALRGTHFLAVLGPSGCGKSSLVRAGLLPRLREGALSFSDQWRYLIMQPGPHPLTELALALARPLGKESLASFQNLLEANERELHLQIRLALHHEPSQARFCLVIDQFEEVFTLCQDRSEREQFVDALRYAATVAGGQTIVVLTMRADFLGHAAAYSPLADLLSTHEFIVSPMGRQELQEAIENPAHFVDVHLEAGLVDAILHDMGQEPGALPLMEHALTRLWAYVGQDMTMTLQAYQAIGGVQGALAQSAETIFTEFTPAEQHLTQRIFLRLTQPGEGTEDTRRRTTKQEFVTRPEETEQIERVIQEFTDQRLLVTSGENQVDVSHEALIRGWPRLRQWIDDNRGALQTHRRLTEAAQTWYDLKRDEGALYRSALLERAQEWRLDHEDDMNQLERDFLNASASVQEQEKQEEHMRQQRELKQAKAVAEAERLRAEEQAIAIKRLRRRALTLAGAVVLAVVAGLVAWGQQQKAAQANRKAQNELVKRTWSQSVMAKQNNNWLQHIHFLARYAQLESDPAAVKNFSTIHICKSF